MLCENAKIEHNKCTGLAWRRGREALSGLKASQGLSQALSLAFGQTFLAKPSANSNRQQKKQTAAETQ